ncbi:hypothetical protein ACQP1P_20260 [Dactylosporangium sp. CA-052675]|uniref:hypothetical protein n=1 Tax=Dactylosporangium sp. CA-052675 TaxID=3239927 RepID=UPI003D8B96E3
MIGEWYRIATLPVVWALLAGFLGLELAHAALLAAHAMAAAAVVAGGREGWATGLWAVPSRHRFFVLKVLAVALPSTVLSWSARCVLLSLFALGLALVARGVVWPLAFLAGVPVMAAPVLRAVAPRVVPYLPHEAGLPVLAGWAAAALAAAWVALVGRDA